MKKLTNIFMILVTSLTLMACNNEKSENELWVYTSLYRDTITDLTPILKKKFPKLEIKWFQAGSEDIATKVNAELLAGSLKADVLISSDRFWYEEMASSNKLAAYRSAAAQKIPASLVHPQKFYSTLSIPVMVMVYNSDVLKTPPTSFKEMMDTKWKNLFTTGSPLASGTNFTTMAMLQHHYGWDYFKKIRDNNTIAQGGNSAVIRRLQNKERSVGWVLLENILRFQGKDDRLKVIYPTDGVVTQANVIAITKKDGKRENAKKFVDFMYSRPGQESMTRSYMYSPLPNFPAPVGAPNFSVIFKNSFLWTQDFINSVVKSREELKEEYTKIMFE
jgi:iron(III) transport system substrate-binding protein